MHDTIQDPEGVKKKNAPFQPSRPYITDLYKEGWNWSLIEVQDAMGKSQTALWKKGHLYLDLSAVGFIETEICREAVSKSK